MDRGIGNDEKVLVTSNIEDIKFRINTAEHGSELEFRLLEMILSKTFTLLFMLNGGAAVALLAFWSNYITYDATSIRGILWTLGFFAGGAALSVIVAALSYISQSYYCQSTNENIMYMDMTLQIGAPVESGILMPEEGARKYKEKYNRYMKKANRYRNIAIGVCGCAIICFLIAVIIFACTILR